MTQASVCVVASGDAMPDLSGQTLQDYQLLRATTEHEALERSGAQAFLWLSSASKPAPRALEDCLWALQCADWVTWKDTGAAPPPSLRGVAGPLGISRRMMQKPDPKPGGEVRRLPWRCLLGEAERPTQESISAGAAHRQSAGVVNSGLGRFAAHVKNSGWFSAERWREDALGTALMAVPLTLKERINRNTGRAVFDLSGYRRFRPDAAYVEGRLIEPLRYTVAAKGERKRVGVVVRHLGEMRAALDFAGEIERSRNEVVLIVESSADNSWKEAWLSRADWIFEVGRLVEQGEAERMVLSLALNWEFDAVAVCDSAVAYRILPALKEKLPKIRTVDLVRNDFDVELTEDVIDSLDFRAAASDAMRERLEGAAPEGQQVIVVRGGVDVRPEAPRIDERLTVGFAGPLEESSGAQLLPLMVAELARLRGDKTDWMVTGSGSLEMRLRKEMKQSRVQFADGVLGDADVWVVLTSGAAADRACLEAMSRGRAVVATEAEGRAELVAEDCGVLIPGGRDREFRVAQAVADLLKDPALVRAMGAAGRQRAERMFSREESRRGYRVLARRVLGEIEAIGA